MGTYVGRLITEIGNRLVSMNTPTSIPIHPEGNVEEQSEGRSPHEAIMSLKAVPHKYSASTSISQWFASGVTRRLKPKQGHDLHGRRGNMASRLKLRNLDNAKSE